MGQAGTAESGTAFTAAAESVLHAPRRFLFHAVVCQYAARTAERFIGPLGGFLFTPVKLWILDHIHDLLLKPVVKICKGVYHIHTRQHTVPQRVRSRIHGSHPFLDLSYQLSLKSISPVLKNPLINGDES